MGDVRFNPAFERLRASDDRTRVLQAMRHEEVVEALAAASRAEDPLLANVLATEALNRIKHARALGGAVALGVAAALTLTYVIVLAFAVAEPNYLDHVILMAVTVALLLGALLIVGTLAWGGSGRRALSGVRARREARRRA